MISHQDKDFMAIALDLARLGLGRTSPNPAVGAVIVKNDKVIATGFHRKAGLPHAEIEALTSPLTPLLTQERGTAVRRSGEVWKGATLYVTLEPCCPPKSGRTPPCAPAIVQSGIREVVVAMRDPDKNVSGKGIRFLKRHGVRVRVGILEKESRRLNEAYLRHRTRGVPFVTLKIASTLDGKVGRGGALPRGRWITGPEARAFGHTLRDQTDAILVGIHTVKVDNPRLTTRLSGKKGRDPIRIVLDSSLKISPSANVLRVRSQSPTWIATRCRPGDRSVKRLKKAGVEILFCKKGRDGRVDLKDLLKKLGERGVLTLLVEGGPTVWSSFLREKLADRIVLFLAPSFLGRKGIPIPNLPPLSEISLRKIGEDLIVEGVL